VLGDALSYVQNEYRPKKIIDVATLTGACMGKASPCMIVAVVLSR
jgi:leucyl aminopeptidase